MFLRTSRYLIYFIITLIYVDLFPCESQNQLVQKADGTRTIVALKSAEFVLMEAFVMKTLEAVFVLLDLEETTVRLIRVCSL